MRDLRFETHSPEATQRIARVLGEQCAGGEALYLLGPLGSGKTCFTQGLAWGLGVEEYTHSPTFVMVNEYHGRLTLYHVDLYRVDSVEEAMDLGLEEYLTAKGVCAIEWADKVLDVLGSQGLVVELSYVDDQWRSLSLRALDSKHDALLGKLEAAMKKLDAPGIRGA